MVISLFQSIHLSSLLETPALAVREFSQCAAICPTNRGCVPLLTDYWDWWFQVYDRHVNHLAKPEQSEYWNWWFEQYAQKLRSHC